MTVDLNKSYLVGVINLVAVVLLAVMVGVLMIFHIKNFQDNVSLKVSWQLVTFDPFASILIGLVVVALVINAFSSLVQFSDFFSAKSEQNVMALSITSILWIVLYFSSSFSRAYLGFVVMPLMLSGIIVVLSRQIKSYPMMGAIYLITMLVWIAGYF